jgi:hypothetical protein
MSQIYKNVTGSGTAVVQTLTPDVGGAISPTGGNINVLGTGTATGQTVPDNNFETFNIGSSTMLICHRYQGSVDTSDGAGQTQTVFSFPMTAGSTISIEAQVSGFEATIPGGTGGSITGAGFRGGAGATLIASGNKLLGRSTATLAATDFDLSVSGNNLIVTVTGQPTYTMSWYCIATITQITAI